MPQTRSHKPLAPQAPPLAGPNVFFSTRSQRVGLARQRFFDEGARPTGLVNEAVIQSWARCTQARRDPSETLSFTPVTRSRIDHTLARNRMLLDAGHDELEQLQAMLAGTTCKAILTDANCIVVHATPSTREDGELVWLAGRVGVDLSEGCVGTAAPGMVALSGQGCVVLGGEHYFDLNHSMRCAAAPIRGARGELVGVLDLSCEARPFQFDAASLVQLFATSIENRLLMRQLPPHALLRFQATAGLLHTPLEGLAAFDELGQMSWMNAAGKRLLQAPGGGRALADVEEVFGLTRAQLFDAARGGETRLRALPNGLRLCVQAQWRGGAAQVHVGEALQATPVALLAAPAVLEAQAPTAQGPQPRLRDADLQLIASTLASCSGNVSHAARQLGVSRGLIYRRLRQQAQAA